MRCSGTTITHVAQLAFERICGTRRIRAGAHLRENQRRFEISEGEGGEAGRPKALEGEALGVAKALLKSGDMTAAQVAVHVGVSRATSYRELASLR